MIKALAPDQVYFWAAHSGAELDLLLIKNGRQIGVECKRMDAPRLTPSMLAAVQDLALERLLVVYPGSLPYALSEAIRVVPLAQFAAAPESMWG